MKKLFNLLLTILVCQGVSASLSLFNIENLNNQLSNNAILCMHQDPYGFMWFGTYDGLNLYDGKEVTIFRYEFDNPTSLSGNTIHNIANAGDSHLWIATQLGLNKFSLIDRKVVESYPEYKRVDMIATDSRGNGWMVSKDESISYYDAEQKAFYDMSLPGIKLSDIKSLFLNDEERLCLVRPNGLLQYITLESREDMAGKYYTLSIKDKTFHNRVIRQVFYEDRQVYFIDENNDLFVYNDAKQQKILLRNISGIIKKYGLIISLTSFKNDVYIAFMHSGLVRLDMSSHDDGIELINMTIGIFGILKDRYQELLWVGTDGHGVNMYCSEKDKFGNILLDNLPFTAKRPIRAFYTDEYNTLWVGTKGDGIIRIKNYENFKNTSVPAANVRHFITHGGLYENPVYIFVRSNYNRDDLWMGTEGNISYYSYKDDKINIVEDTPTPYSLSNVHTLCEVNDSTLWVSSKGLCKVIIDKSRKPYRIKSKKNYVFQKDGNNINDEFYSIIYDGDSTLFIGSRRGYGAIRLNIYTDKYSFISMDKAENKALGDVICLHINKDSVLYLGASSGLTQIRMTENGENEIKQFNRNDGIINDMIHGILEDSSGIIWLSTNKGLVKYNPQNDSFFNVKSSQLWVTEYSDDAYWHCPITDRLFFGGVNGLIWIEPKDGTEVAAYEPDLLFTTINHFGKEQTLYEYNNSRTRLKLPANQNTFQIFFSVLDYINGDSYDYSYMLENYNEGWVSLRKENKISFTNLPPGNYVLKVKYKNDVAPADNKIYSLPIVVLPPWYLSTVAYVIYMLLVIFLIIYIVYYVRLKFRQKQLAVARRVKEEQKEKLYESKLRFFTNITHELYTPLTLINGALEQIKREGGNERINKYTNILQNNVLSLNDLIQEILDFRKIEEAEINPYTLKNISVANLLNNLLTSFAEIAVQNDISLISDVEEDLYWNTDKASFKKIISNLVSNAFKYTPVGGTVKVTVREEGESLKIVVYNTGKGIEPEKLKTVFNRYHILENADVNAKNQMTARNGLGLFICHSMTKLLQGEITVKSVVNEYVEFTVILPNLIKDTTEPVKPEITRLSFPDAPRQEMEEKNKVNPVKLIEETSASSVLVVDDNAEIVEMVSDILSQYYHVLQAYSVKEAMQIIKHQPPSLVITDIMMPEIDGLSFIQMIREDKYCKHLPVIALSARIDEKDLVEGYAAGADAYVTKPFSSEVLLSMVNRFLVNKEEIKDYYDSAESSFEYTEGKLLHQKDKEFIDTVLSIMKNNISSAELGPEFIADKMKITSRNLNRQLKRILTVTPTEFIKDYKFSYAAKLLITTNMSVKEIIYKIGITNKSYFYNEFAKRYDASPKQYKIDNTKIKE